MIKIRLIHGSYSIISSSRIEQVKEIFRASFPAMADFAEKIPLLLKDPASFGFNTTLLIAENANAVVDAFALILHFHSIQTSFLDFLAVRPGTRGEGMGGMLYEELREHCLGVGSKSLYYEVEPDDPGLIQDAEKVKKAVKRIRFYENYGARIIKSDAYAAPVGNPPTYAYLMYDSLGRPDPLAVKEVKSAVSMILVRRFGRIVDPLYIERVLSDFDKGIVEFRKPYPKKKVKKDINIQVQKKHKYPLIYSQKHKLHHVKERGYFERPVRIDALLASAEQSGIFKRINIREHGEKPILDVHDNSFVHYLKTVCAKLKNEQPVYPDTFPIRRSDKKPKELAVQAGYYCLDTGTPLYKNAYIAARTAVDTALTAADEMLAGVGMAYAACRPPGHHAGKKFYGGFCYFNNSAIAAKYLSVHARVAILDIDFHHGNGTQNIYYDSNEVLTVSIHGHPDYSYPYFSGYKNEAGEGMGTGYNHNFPLLSSINNEKYFSVLKQALDIINQFSVEILIVNLGYDILKGDPTGNFTLSPQDLYTVARNIALFKKPVLIIQEGGYNLRNIKNASLSFFNGFGSV